MIGEPHFFSSKSCCFSSFSRYFFTKFIVSHCDATKYGCEPHVHPSSLSPLQVHAQWVMKTNYIFCFPGSLSTSNTKVSTQSTLKTNYVFTMGRVHTDRLVILFTVYTVHVKLICSCIFFTSLGLYFICWQFYFDSCSFTLIYNFTSAANLPVPDLPNRASFKKKVIYYYPYVIQYM